MSPLMQRRWHIFKQNRRGYVSLWLFSFLAAILLFAEIISNDQPILVQYDGEIFIPVLTEYSETDFGGEFDTAADYRDAYLRDKINDNGWILWPPVRFSYNTINYNLPTPAPSPPTKENWLGTDDQGRDVFARLVYGLRVSLAFGILLTIASSIIGVTAGAIQGYLGGKTDLIFQRFIEIWGGLPLFFLLIILSSFVEPNFTWLFFIMLLFSWMALVGVVRAEVLKVRKMDYVRAARALGVKERVIIFRHVLPNCLVATVTFMPFILTSSITTLTALDFLGFGMPPGSPSLGELLAQGKANIEAPWLGLTGFAVLAITLTLLTFIGEAVRDALNPHKT